MGQSGRTLKLVGGGRCPSLFRLLLGLVVLAVGQIIPIAFRSADCNMTILSGVMECISESVLRAC